MIYLIVETRGNEMGQIGLIKKESLRAVNNATGKETPFSRTAVIFDIQRFSLHDGPGIRTTIFFKGCPLRCVWCQNPESHKNNAEIAFYSETCSRCFTCRVVCPRQAVIDGAHQRIDYSLCDSCGECASLCPTRSLRLIGRTYNCDEVMKEILKDQDYYLDSKGGITLSGGEPMLQSRFVYDLLRRVKQKKIHATIETCGLFRWSDMQTLLRVIDLVFFDLKCMDSTKHQRYTGAGNKQILNNFSKLAGSIKNLQARLPIVPGFNDDNANIRATAAFLKSAGHKTIHCLPYHNLGESKIKRISTTLVPLGLKTMSGNDLDDIKKLFKKEGIHAIIYD